MAKEKKQKRVSKKSTVVDIILTVFCFCLLCLSCVFFYQNVYLEKFYVSGQSMWPTLNEYALDQNGKLIGQDGRDKSGEVGTKVEVGVMDTHKSAKKKIKRFDIVTTYYSDNDTYFKIKRIIGLPGETLRFTEAGDLYINDSFVEQPINSEVVASGTYTTEEVKLADDEYFVCGDNRKGSNSGDSRTNGNIKKRWIVGRVVAIYGIGIVSEINGEKDVRNRDIDYYKWPRFTI